MVTYKIVGGNILSGVVDVPGNKNSVLPLMAGALLTNGITKITNVPQIKDVLVMSEILETLGAKIVSDKDILEIDTRDLHYEKIPQELTTKLRASILLLGPLLAKFKRAEIGFPGGDVIGKRAIGSHLDGLSLLGADFSITKDGISGSISDKVSNEHPVYIFLDEASVTATENLILLAASLPKTTIIENAACEPHVGDLCKMVESMGAKVFGLGSNILKIEGTSNLLPTEAVVGADFMDAGTFAIGAAITGGEIEIRGVPKNDMKMTLLYLERFGVNYRWLKNGNLKIEKSDLKVESEGLGIRQKFQTRPWPGFSPDLMSPLIVLATQAKGSVLLHDWMYETRFFFTDKLVTMGANITLCDPHRVLVTGPTKLHGRTVNSPDIRAGMSLVLAGLVAEGETIVHHAELIERGYEDPVGRLTKLGAKIEKVEQF